MDFYSDNNLKKYSELLHNIWAEVLELIGIRRIIPRYGVRRKVFDFYKKHNYSNNSALDHMDGINFSDQKYINDGFCIYQSDIKTQWKINSQPQRDYYADKDSKVTPSCLGVNDSQEDMNGCCHLRLSCDVEIMQRVIVLKSRAAPALDTWSVKNSSVPTKGGCIQYFNANDKKHFKI